MLLTRDRYFYKNVIMLAIPIALQSLVTFSVGLADSVMVGSLGDAAVSGMYMGGQIQTLLQVTVAGIEGAILILAAQYWGKGDTESIRRIVAIGTRMALVLGLVATAVCAVFPEDVILLFTKDPLTVETGAAYLRIVSLSYTFFCFTQSLIAAMRSVEVAKTGLYVSLCSLAVNVVLNYVLIFGKLGFPAMGVEGAALATLIARIAESCVITVYVFRRDRELQLKPKDMLVKDPMLRRDFIRYGLPIIAGQFVWSVNMMVSSGIIGRQSAEGAVVAVSIAGTLGNLSYVVVGGLSGAVGIITGKTVGAGLESKMREYAKTVQVMFLVVGLLTGLGVYLIRDPFISLYAISDAAAAETARFINVLAVTTVGTCFESTCLFGLVKSGGDISFVFKNDCIFVFGVVLPSAIIATYLGAPAWVVFACLKCDQVLKCFVAVVKIRRYDWMKNLTRS